MIRNKEKVLRSVDWTDFRFHRNCRPGDLDGFMELNGNVYFLFEAKELGARVEPAQRKGLERMTDTLQKGGAEAVLIYFYHKDVDSFINPNESFHLEYYYKKSWYESNTFSLKELTTEFIEEWKRKGIQV